MIKSLIGITAKRRASPPTQIPVILTFDTKNGTGSTSHSLTNVPAGALLVLTTQAETAQNNATVTSTPSLTWTKRADSTGPLNGDAEIHTTIFTAGGNITVNSVFSTLKQSSVCYVVINHEATLSGASSISTLQALPSTTITTTRDNSILIGVISDFQAIDGASRAYTGSPTETQYFFSASATTAYHFYKAAPTTSSYTIGLSTPGGQKAGTCILEVRGGSTSGGTPDTTPPSAPVLSLVSTTSSTINLSWTASTDDTGVVGYDVYVNNSFNGTTINTSYSVTGLTASTTYAIFVKAKDAAGNNTNSNTLNPSTQAGGTFGTLMYSNGYNTNADLNSDQLGLGSISTTVHVEGIGSFKSFVQSGEGQISSGWRSEQQFNDTLSPNDTALVIEYNTLFESLSNLGGLSTQWHGNVSGTSGQLSLWTSGGQFMVQRSTCGGAGCGNIYQTNAVGGGPLMNIATNHWYYMRWEIKFSSSNSGYVRLYIDNVLYHDTGLTKTADGGGQFMKIGQNLFNGPSNRDSVLYVDDLKVWFA